MPRKGDSAVAEENTASVTAVVTTGSTICDAW